MIKNITLLFTLMVTLGLNAQELNEYKLIYDALNKQIESDLITSKELKTQYVQLVDNRPEVNDQGVILQIQDITHKGVLIEFLDETEIKKRSRTGLSIIKVYPLRLDTKSNMIYYQLDKVNILKKEHTLVGKKAYYFKYDCDNDSYISADY